MCCIASSQANKGNIKCNGTKETHGQKLCATDAVQQWRAFDECNDSQRKMTFDE